MSMRKHIQYTEYIIIKKKRVFALSFLTTSPRYIRPWEALRRQTERIP